MQPRYDWQKGQDAWDKGDGFGHEEGRIQDPPLRRWRFVVAVVLIIGLVGASVFWFLNRRARTNTAAVEDDILRTNSLIFQAVMSGDVELLRSNLSGRDPRWVDFQVEALESERVYDQPWWGLAYQSGSLDGSEMEVVLNPEWDSAELVVPLNYEYRAPGGLTKTVQLEQTLVYRRSRERWLLAPADVDFWGERLMFEGRFLTLDYPARDEDIVARLAADLDGTVAEICEAFEGGRCPDGFRVEARLYEDSPDIAGNSGPVRQLPCARGGFELPAPTLVGLPVDEAGYEALLGGYRAEIAAVALTDIIYGADCPIRTPANVVLDYRLNEMGFRFWPLTVSDYGRLVKDGVHLEQAAYYVNNDVSGRVGSGLLDSERPSYALVEFLVDGDEFRLRRIERDLVENPMVLGDYWAALRRWTEGVYGTNGEMEAAWERFLVERAGIGGADAPALPEQKLRLVCNRRISGGSLGAILFELDLRGGEWTAVYPLTQANGYTISLPGDGGAIVAEQGAGVMREAARVLLWEEGEPVVLFETYDNLTPVSVFDFRGRGEQLLVYDRQDQRYKSYFLADCLEDSGCNWSDFGGYPILAPSAERFMSLLPLGNHGYEGRFFRPFGVGRLMTLTDAVVGKSPFWLGDERIGWVGEDGRTVMAMTVAGENYPEEREVLFTLEEVDPLLALDERVVIESVLSNPREPLDLIVTVKDGDGWASIYQVNILRRWVQRLKEQAFWLDMETVYSFELSPEGRWLVVSGNDLADSTAYVHLFEIAGSEVHSFNYKMVFERPMHWTMDWSAGDEWLAIPDNGYIRLIYPAADYQDVVVPEGVGCSGAVWVN